MMEHISIRIETGNAAFEVAPASEVARILRKLADDFEQNGEASSTLRDLNGNFCGEVTILHSDEEE